MSYGVRVWVLALCGMLACNRFDRVCVQVLSQIRHLHGQVYEGRRLCLKARVDTEFVRGGLHSFHNDSNEILQVRANEMVVPERGEKR